MGLEQMGERKDGFFPQFPSATLYFVLSATAPTIPKRQSPRVRWPPRRGGSRHWRPEQTPAVRPTALSPRGAVRRRQSFWRGSPPAPTTDRKSTRLNSSHRT